MENRLENLRIEIDKLIMEKQPDEIRYYVSHLYGVARFCTLLAMKRNLNSELAAIPNEENINLLCRRLVVETFAESARRR